MNNRLTRLQNLESRVGADVVTFTLPNAATVAVNVTKQVPLLILLRMMSILSACYYGTTDDPEKKPLLHWTPAVEKIVGLARRATAITAKDSMWAASLLFAKRIQHFEKTGHAVHFIGHGLFREEGTGRLFDRDLNEVSLPEEQRVEPAKQGA
jgi:hypothetical protein